MLLIKQITADPLQTQTIILADGSSFIFTLYFRSLQFGWFIENIVYKNFILNGLRITNSPNMFHQFRNQIPFGIACFSTANREPSQLQDFSSGVSKLYLLNEVEIIQYNEFLTNG